MVKGLPMIDIQNSSCESCILGKHQRDNFPWVATSSSKEPLELVHTYLCGPMQDQSLGGNFYFLTCIDDFNKKTWVYFLKKKSETFEKFREYKAMAEKQSSRYIKILRSDRGGEYDSKEFIAFYKQHGIERQVMERYTTQKNGVAERKKRTIMNMSRNMFKAKNLSNDFWGVVVSCAIYILNQSPANILKDKVPQESYSCMKSSIPHFKIFRTIAYAHIREKL